MRASQASKFFPWTLDARFPRWSQLWQKSRSKGKSLRRSRAPCLRAKQSPEARAITPVGRPPEASRRGPGEAQRRAGATGAPARREHKIQARGGTTRAWPTDVRSLSQVEALIAGVIQAYGRLDLLVNNAGIGHFGTPLHEMPPEAWAEMMETNLRAVYFAIRAAAPAMIAAHGGQIINIASLAGHNPVPGGCGLRDQQGRPAWPDGIGGGRAAPL